MHETLGAQAKVSAGVVAWVGDQPQVRQLGTFFKGLQRLAARHEVGHVDIAGHHPKGVRELGQGAHHAPCGLERRAKIQVLARIAQLQTVRGRVRFKIVGKLRAKPCGVDEHVRQTGDRQALQMPLQQGLALDLEKGLGVLVTQRTHALTASGAQHHRLI